MTDNGHDAHNRLHLRGVVKRFGQTVAVRGVDLAAPVGSFVTILGPSGSGKTTLLRLVAGFLAPDEGQVVIDGREVSRLPPAERAIGMVFQNYALFPHLTAAENVAYGLKMRRWPKARRTVRVAEMLTLVGLDGLGDRLPRELSGGQQQRVALARALAFEPSLLLMDEPLGALDRELRMRMAFELRRIHRDAGATAVYVTHDREEALTLSDWIVIMHDGRIEAEGTAADLYTRPRTGFVASFFGGHNLVEVDVVRRIGADRAVIRLLGRQVEVATGQPLTGPGPALLSVPEEAISRTPRSDASAPMTLRVLDDLYLGNSVRANVELTPGPDAEAAGPDARTDTGPDAEAAGPDARTDTRPDAGPLRLRVLFPGGDRPDPAAGPITAHLDITALVAVPADAMAQAAAPAGNATESTDARQVRDGHQ